MQQMMLLLAFQYNTFMFLDVFFNTWCGQFAYPAVHFCPINIGSSGTLCDPLHGLPGSSPGPMGQFSVLPTGPDLQCVLQVVRHPNVVVLNPNQILFMNHRVLQNSVQIPRYGLYHHVKQSETFHLNC